WRRLLLILLLSFGHRDCCNGCSGIWRAVRKGHAGILFPLPNPRLAAHCAIEWIGSRARRPERAVAP
ncbi:unnamed protein product, partial [Gulo gulo]